MMRHLLAINGGFQRTSSNLAPNDLLPRIAISHKFCLSSKVQK